VTAADVLLDAIAVDTLNAARKSCSGTNDVKPAFTLDMQL